jgi:hypothetical protein
VALKADMMNMMAILLEHVLPRLSSSQCLNIPLFSLRNINDAQKVDPEGTTLEVRMRPIVKDAEQDIRDCR